MATEIRDLTKEELSFIPSIMNIVKQNKQIFLGIHPDHQKKLDAILDLIAPNLIDLPECNCQDKSKSECCNASYYTDGDGNTYCGNCDGDGRCKTDYNEGCCGSICDDATCYVCTQD